jgi:hypothetical protein
MNAFGTRIGGIALCDAETYTAALLAESSLAGVQKVIGSGMNPGHARGCMRFPSDKFSRRYQQSRRVSSRPQT